MKQLLMVVLLAGCAGMPIDHQPEPVPASGPYIVSGDPGGNATAYKTVADELRARGTHVIIRGRAASGAAWFAYLPNACLEAGAVISFHGARDLATGELVPAYAKTYAARLLPGAAARYMAVGQHLLSGYDNLTREQAIALDPQLKRCPE
jgi:hypothetical protein